MIKTGDKVKIIAGKDKGKTGAIIQVFPELQRVVVEGLNIAVKHIKKRGNQPGQKIEFPAELHVSNVMIIDSKTREILCTIWDIPNDGGDPGSHGDDEGREYLN